MDEGTNEEGIESMEGMDEEDMDQIDTPSTSTAGVGRISIPSLSRFDLRTTRLKWKEKLSNAWNNVKYNARWMSVSEYDESTVVLLSRPYSFFGRESDRVDSFSQFVSDYRSRIWITYRTGFPPFPSTSLTSDCGWGCTLRSAQMMLAQSLVLTHLGRGWRLKEETGKEGELECTEEDVLHRQIISLFIDSPDAPLSLLSILPTTQPTSSPPYGSWFSPSQAAHILRKGLSNSCSVLTCGMEMEVVMDGRVDMEYLEMRTMHWTRRLLLVVCIRAGLHSINEAYYPHLKHILHQSSSVGFIGGKTNRSVYIVGFTNNELIYLDPHLAQPHADIPVLSSFHSSHLSKCSFSNMDPSCALGWLFSSKEELVEAFRYLNLQGVIDMEEGEGISRRNEFPLFTLFTHSPPTFDHIDYSDNGF